MEDELYYKNLYLKYKGKYIKLKNELSQEESQESKNSQEGGFLKRLFGDPELDKYKNALRDELNNRLVTVADLVNRLTLGLENNIKEQVLFYYYKEFGKNRNNKGEMFDMINNLRDRTKSLDNLLNNKFKTNNLTPIVTSLINIGINSTYEQEYLKNIISNNLTEKEYPKNKPSLNNLIELVKVSSYIDICRKLGLELNINSCTQDKVNDKKDRIANANNLIKNIVSSISDTVKEMEKYEKEVNEVEAELQKALEKRNEKIKDLSFKAKLNGLGENYDEIRETLRMRILGDNLNSKNVLEQLELSRDEITGNIDKDKQLLVNALKEKLVTADDIKNDPNIRLQL
jgi:hypothetical protein